MTRAKWARLMFWVSTTAVVMNAANFVVLRSWLAFGTMLLVTYCASYFYDEWRKS